jgi:hypothetical protein
VSTTNRLRLRLATVVGIGGFLASLSAPGCSAITNTTAIQCTKEADCLSLGAGTRCDPTTKTCVSVPEDQDRCTHNSECIDAAKGSPAICRKSDRKCVNLFTPTCDTVVQQSGDLLDDNAVVVGYIVPYGVTWDQGASDLMLLNLKLAQHEIMSSGGLPALSGQSKGRPLVFLACHEFQASEGIENLLSAANHLVKDVQVPIVIGPIDPDFENALSNLVFLPNKVFNILPNGGSVGLADQAAKVNPAAPIIWQLQGHSDRGTGKIMTDFILKYLEPRLRNTDGVVGPIRVASIYDGGYFGTSYNGGTASRIIFNGKSAADNLADGNYISINIGSLVDPIANPSPSGKIAAGLAQLYAFQPHVVMYSAFPGATGPLMVPMFLNWPMSVPKPYYLDLTGSAQYISADLRILEVFGVRDRIFTPLVQSNPDQAIVDQYIIRLSAEFPDQNIPANRFTRAFISQVSYDAAWLSAYAIAAVRDKPLTADNIAATLPQLRPPNPKSNVGPLDPTNPTSGANPSASFTALSAGKGIDLQGLAGHMDINPNDGLSDYDLTLWCPGMNPDGSVTLHSSGFSQVNGVVPDGTPVNCP